MVDLGRMYGGSISSHFPCDIFMGPIAIFDRHIDLRSFKDVNFLIGVYNQGPQACYTGAEYEFSPARSWSKMGNKEYTLYWYATW